MDLLETSAWEHAHRRTRRWFLRDCGVGLGKIALASLQHEGYGTNLFTGRDVSDRKTFAARGGLDWLASENVKVQFSVAVTTAGVQADTVVYNNLTTFSGFAYANGGATNQAGNTITTMVADDITPGAGLVGSTINSFTFTVANLNAVAVSARARVRFYAGDGAGGGGLVGVVHRAARQEGLGDVAGIDELRRADRVELERAVRRIGDDDDGRALLRGSQRRIGGLGIQRRRDRAAVSGQDRRDEINRACARAVVADAALDGEYRHLRNARSEQRPDRLRLRRVSLANTHAERGDEIH